MLFALLTSLDCFLYYFTVLPIRLIKGYVKQFKRYRQHYRLQQRSGHTHNIPFRYEITSREYKERCMIFIIVISSILLSKLDTSKLYHRIKQQSTMKLYMLFSVLEMADKMLASLWPKPANRYAFQEKFYTHTATQVLIDVNKLGICYNTWLCIGLPSDRNKHSSKFIFQCFVNFVTIHAICRD